MLAVQASTNHLAGVTYLKQKETIARQEQTFLHGFGLNLSGLAKTHDQNNRTQRKRAQA